MWQHFAVLNAILTLCVANAVTDMTDVCKGLRSGDVAPHPTDCSAYFICGTVPTLNYCSEGLHFDAKRKVCNWPMHANCKLQDEPLANDGNSVSSTIRINPVFVAIDVNTGKATNPMNKYDAKNVQCQHYGAYFLPHPDSCRRYYLCAYGHLHKHKCGRGTAWNYKTQECELNDIADCYSRIIAGIDIDAMLDDIDLDDNNGLNNYMTPTPYPTPLQSSTVCFVIDTTIVTGATTDSTFHPTGTYHTATTDPTWYPTGTYHTATTNRRPTATTPRADSGSLPATGGRKCPMKGEAYLPNVLDCKKYFICIAGIPVPTTCPHNLYWDQNAEFCDVASNVQCYTA